jgi:hypothetical protein
MSGEPSKPRSGDVAASNGTAGSQPLSESKSSTAADIAAFVKKARAMSPHAEGGRGRLIFALDATMSRQPTWDMACALQADMFREAASLGSLDIRLVYYRGFNECRATAWISDSAQLAKLMGKIDCRGGNTQIGKVLSEARREGHDAAAEQAFREIARLTGGAWCKFDPGAAAQLRELLRAAAAYAAGGREALKRLSSRESGAAKLLGQMK